MVFAASFWAEVVTWAYSDTFLTTDFGLAQSHSTWLDINVTHSTLRFVPGTLTLCGHDVLRIYWETFCDELGAHSETVRPVMETLLSAPHALSAEDVQLAPKLLALLQEEGFNDLTISTDRGVCSLSSSLSPALTITLKDEEPIGGYQPTYDLHPLDRLNLLLELMQADSPDEIRAILEEKRQQGLLRKGKWPTRIILRRMHLCTSILIIPASASSPVLWPSVTEPWRPSSGTLLPGKMTRTYGPS